MGRTVALKVINQRLIQNAEVVERFHREVRTAARLSHPNIVTSHDAEQAENIHFLVMEYVDGVNLATLVKESGYLSVAKACDYARQAATGLQYAHEKGIVHRDIKPHNLMLTSMETVKILDFGLASLVEGLADPVDEKKVIEITSLTMVGSIMGTPDFISPEQAANAHLADIRSDIYSLGATLYFLLSGQPPFATGSVAERLEMHAALEPLAIRSLRSDVSEELSDVISRMMAKNPDERFQIPLDVARALESHAVSQVKPIETASQTRSSRGGRSWWPLSPRTTFICAAAAVFGLICGAIVYVETDKGTLIIDSVDDTVKVIITQGRDEAGSAYLKTIVVDTVTGSEVVRLASGEYKLSLGSKENEFEANQGGLSGDSVSKRREQSNKSLVQLERALSMTGEGADLSAVLANLAKASLDAGLNGKAKEYADRLLKESSTSDSVYAGNQVLGWIALRTGELDSAGKYLVASG